jgi:class 3 adenylate cyclase
MAAQVRAARRCAPDPPFGSPDGADANAGRGPVTLDRLCDEMSDPPSDDEDSLGPSLDLVKAEVVRIFADVEEFTIAEFMESDVFSL